MFDAILRFISLIFYGRSDDKIIGAKESDRGLPRSSKWPTVRKGHLQKEPKCQWCGTKWALQVHHKIPFSVCPAKETSEDNLITLCELPLRHCHLKRGHLGNFRNYDALIKEKCEQHKKELAERKHGKNS